VAKPTGAHDRDKSLRTAGLLLQQQKFKLADLFTNHIVVISVPVYPWLV